VSNIRKSLQQAYSRLATFDTARLDTQILLCHVLNANKAYLIAHDDYELTENEQTQYEALIERRAKGEPIAYIIGSKGFYDLDFLVTPDILIPRPETEHLIEAALDWANKQPVIIAADIGTGSGVIAITVAKHVAQAKVHAMDISSAALNVARKNAEKNQVSITFHESYLAQALIQEKIKVNLLMANLPYIRSEEMDTLDVAKTEPHLALDGGEDGLDLVRQLLQQVPEICLPNALILLEIGAEQAQAVLDFAHETVSPKNIVILKDYAGHDRVVRIEV
jgi:release factor glutamine methyltransferase